MDQRRPAFTEKLPSHVRSALDHARAALQTEARLRAYGPFLLTLKIFLIVVLLGVLPRLGGVVHALFLMGGIVLLALTLRRGFQTGRTLDEAQLRRQVEKASALPHRPLEALVDTPALAPALWESHKARMAALVAGSTLRWPRLNWRHLDHPALRMGSLGLLLLTLVFVRGEALPHIQQAVRPDLAAVLPTATLDAWITPPAYTNQPPIALRAGLPEILVPEGSTLSVRVGGGWFAPVVTVAQKAYRLMQDDSESYVLNAPLTSGRVAVRQDGRRLGQWQVRLLVDAAPQISFAASPSANAQGVLRLDYAASDDLGLASVTATITTTTPMPGLMNEALVLALPLSSPPPKEARSFRFFDLTSHPWAGRSVSITLEARDGKGQVSHSEPVLFTLPERSFVNPIAKAIILMRRQLVTDGLKARMPVMNSIMDLLAEVRHDRPNDLLGFMALNAIGSRLLYTADASVVPAVLPLMWETALHFEDDGTGSALADLRQAQQALEDALNRGASSAELQELMNRLEQAINAYVEDLARHADQQSPQNGDRQTQVINQQDLKNYLDQMRNLAESGARDQARDMLQRLSQLMENMHAQSSDSTGDPEADAQLRELGDIAREQQQLLDRTFRTTPEGQQSPSQNTQENQSQTGQAPSLDDLLHQPSDQQQGQSQQGQSGQSLPHSEGLPNASEQGALRQRLDQFRQSQETGAAGQMLDRSGQAMESAQEGLRRGDARSAMSSQGEALTRLQDAMRQLRDQAEAGRMRGTDPFGNRPDGQGGRHNDTSSIKIPDPTEAERIRGLLNDLRSRAGDMSRPQEERDYLDRLLKWF